MLVSKTIGGLFNGVSQQPPELRLESQAEAQENAFSTLVNGMGKRSPMAYVAKLDSVATAGCHVHPIDRDVEEQYNVIFTGDNTEPIEIFTLAGVKKVVRYGTLTEDLVFTASDTPKAYLANLSGAPREVIKAVSVADYTIVANTEKTVQNDPTEVLQTKPNVALVYIKQAGAGVTYTVRINGLAATYHIDTEDNPNTNTVSSSLQTSLAGLALTGFNAIRKGNVIKLWFTDGRDFEFSVQDTWGNTCIVGIKDTVSTYTDLPAECFGLTIVQINDTTVYKWTQVDSSAEYYLELLAGGDPSVTTPDYVQLETTKFTAGVIGSLNQQEWAFGRDPSNAFDTLYVRMTADEDPDAVTTSLESVTDESMGQKVKVIQNATSRFSTYYVQYINRAWTECVGWNLHNKLDSSTMPHRLVRMSDGTFVFAPCIWEERLVGDEKTAPTPSLVDSTINYVTFFKNRLVFLSKDNLICSKAGDYFNLFPFTAMEVLDDDPIDVGVASTEVVNLREALPFHKNLLLRSDKRQFIVGGGDTLLTPKTISIDPTTNFDTIPLSTSASAGSTAYFACPNNEYLTIREYFIAPDSLVDDAADVTVHLPRYIPTGNIELQGCPAGDSIFGFVPDDPYTLYVYKYFWTGDKKAQSAWGKWTFSNAILGFCIFATTLYLFVQVGDDVCLAKLQLQPELSAGLAFTVRLDLLSTVLGSYDEASNTTTWTLPFTDPDDTTFIVVDSTSGLAIDDPVKVGSSITAIGDYSGNVCHIGKTYQHLYEFSPWFMRDQKDNVITGGRLQHRNIVLTFHETGYFQVRVIPLARADTYQEWTWMIGDIVDWDTTTLTKGSARFSIMSRAEGYTRIQILNNSHFPATFTAVQHEGTFVIRSRPI